MLDCSQHDHSDESGKSLSISNLIRDHRDGQSIWQWKRAAEATLFFENTSNSLLGSAAGLGLLCRDDVTLRSAFTSIALDENAVVAAGGDHLTAQHRSRADRQPCIRRHAPATAVVAALEYGARAVCRCKQPVAISIDPKHILGRQALHCVRPGRTLVGAVVRAFSGRDP